MYQFAEFPIGIPAIDEEHKKLFSIVQALAEKGVTIKEGMSEDYHAFKERQYDQLADTLREYLNMEEIYGMLREAHLE